MAIQDEFFDLTLSTGSVGRAAWANYVKQLLSPLQRTAAEISAGVTPTSYSELEVEVLRYHDGTSDITTALGVALDAALNSAAKSVTVKLPAGAYTISSRISKTITSVSRAVSIKGEHRRTVLTSTVVGEPTLEILDAVYVKVSDLRLVGNDTTGGSGNGHALAFIDQNPGSGTTYPQHVELDNLVIEGFRGNDVDESSAAMVACGVYVGNGVEIYGRKCFIEDNGIGAYFDGTEHSGFEKSTFVRNDKWGIAFMGGEDGCYSHECNFLNNGTRLGSYSETLNGDTVPYGGVLAESCTEVVNLRGNKYKNNTSAIIGHLSSLVNVDGEHLRPENTSNNGQAGLWFLKCAQVNVRNPEILYVTDGSATYTGCLFDVGRNTEDAILNWEGGFFNHSDTVNDDIVVDGNGATRDVVVNIRGVNFGYASRGAGATIDNCIRLHTGTFHGEIVGNQFIAGNGVPDTITDAIDISGATIGRMRIDNNSEHADGTITNSWTNWDTETATGTFSASLGIPVTDIDSSGGAVTLTVPDGTFEGQRKVIAMSDASNSSTCSVSSHETSDPEVFTFADANDYLVLEWSAIQAVWWTVKNIGAAT